MRTERSALGTDKTAVILAAGAGARLGELGRRYSKPMVPIRERPLIDWVIASLRTAGLARIIVVGNGVADLDFRNVYIVVPPTGGVILI